MKTAFIGVGSNLGERELQIRQAAEQLEKKGIGKMIRCSALYQTSPWGNIDQPDYLNQVWEIRTGLGPFELMEALLQLEKQAGRERLQRWGARTLDLDLLFYEDYRIRTEVLTLPHPSLHLRNFVLAPMAEIAPDWVHPLFNQTIRMLAAQSPDEEVVELWERPGNSSFKFI